MALDAFDEEMARPFGVPSRGGRALRLISAETILTPGTFTRLPPPGAVLVKIEAYGSGGSGQVSGGALNATQKGQGGAGGECALVAAAVQPNDVFSLVVPAGGAGKLASNTSVGNPGSATTVSRASVLLASAAGGAAGTTSTGSGQPPTTGAASSGSVLDTSTPGIGTVGTQPTLGPGGKAAGPNGGLGGIATTAQDQNGNPGQAPGGGGSGAHVYVSGPNSVTTGAGASGGVVLNWYGVQ